MNQFLDKLGLLSVWEKFPIDYTHLHIDLASSSILDNFFVTKELLEHVVDAGPVHLGDNLSRHSPVMIKICIENTSSRVNKSDIPRTRRPAWLKATEVVKDEFTCMLELQLEQLVLPCSLLCSDVHCTNIHLFLT